MPQIGPTSSKDPEMDFFLDFFIFRPVIANIPDPQIWGKMAKTCLKIENFKKSYLIP